MAITYPRDFPTDAAFSSINFSLGDISVQNILQSGAVQTMEIGPSLWRADFTTVPVDATGRRVWQAWELSLRNGRTFLAWDPEKRFPAAYGRSVLALTRAGGGAFDGTATLASVAATTVSVTGLPAGYTAKAGDMLSFDWSGLRVLHMLTEDVTANGAGAATFPVHPPVQTSPAPAGGAAVALMRPACTMKIIPNTFDAPASGMFAPVKFQAVQAITP
ncbi:hypothetical protein V5F29_10910 [Xanthobacter aminoxidans]|uniref:hypothetical protein n=1 Tax=Xanthobacter aminoxidans TaxID=186280 RepID=UPI003726F9A1